MRMVCSDNSAFLTFSPWQRMQFFWRKATPSFAKVAFAVSTADSVRETSASNSSIGANRRRDGMWMALGGESGERSLSLVSLHTL